MGRSNSHYTNWPGPVSECSRTGSCFRAATPGRDVPSRTSPRRRVSAQNPFSPRDPGRCSRPARRDGATESVLVRSEFPPPGCGATLPQILRRALGFQRNRLPFNNLPPFPGIQPRRTAIPRVAQALPRPTAALRSRFVSAPYRLRIGSAQRPLRLRSGSAVAPG